MAGGLGDDEEVLLPGDACGVSTAGIGLRVGEAGKGTFAATPGDCCGCEILEGDGVLGRGGGSMLPLIVPRVVFSTSSDGAFSLLEKERLD